MLPGRMASVLWSRLWCAPLITKIYGAVPTFVDHDVTWPASRAAPGRCRTGGSAGAVRQRA